MNDTALYVTSAHEIGWGLLLVAVSLGMHAIGMITTLRFHGAYKDRFDRNPTLLRGMVGLILASWMILAVHLLRGRRLVALFQWKECFPNLSIAIYFALDEYTTVGSPLDLPSNWRLLEGMIATAGLLGFAWSTGVLFSLASTFQENQLEASSRRGTRRTPPPSWRVVCASDGSRSSDRRSRPNTPQLSARELSSEAERPRARVRRPDVKVRACAPGDMMGADEERSRQRLPFSIPRRAARS